MLVRSAPVMTNQIRLSRQFSLRAADGLIISSFNRTIGLIIKDKTEIMTKTNKCLFK